MNNARPYFSPSPIGFPTRFSQLAHRFSSPPITFRQTVRAASETSIFQSTPQHIVADSINLSPLQQQQPADLLTISEVQESTAPMEGQSQFFSSSDARAEDRRRSHSADHWSDHGARSRSISPQRHHTSQSYSQSQSVTAPQVQFLFSDASYAPPSFNGAPSQDAERWVRRFKHYVDFRQLSDSAAIQLFKLLLTDAAADWLESVPQAEQSDMKVLYKTFMERFATSELQRWKQASSIFVRQQGPTELVDTYITDMLNLAKRVPITDKTVIRYALIKGFKPCIRQYVLQSSPTTLEDTLKAARIAEAATIDGSAEAQEVASLTKDVRDLIAAFKTLQDKSRQPTPERVANITGRNDSNSARSQSPAPRRVTFEDRQQPNERSYDRRTPSPQYRHPVTNTPRDWAWPEPRQSTQWTPRPSQQYNRPSAPIARGSLPQQQQDRSAYDYRSTQQYTWQHQDRPVYNNSGKQSQFSSPRCRNCGTVHQPVTVNPHACFATNLSCFNCGRRGHIRIMCRSPPASSPPFRDNYPPQQ
jgi:hypothetical protein